MATKKKAAAHRRKKAAPPKRGRPFAPKGESREAKFTRIAAVRMTNILVSLNRLKTLRPPTYLAPDGALDKMHGAIEGKVEEVFEILTQPTTAPAPVETFSFED